jgi:hypothetical protein
VLPGKRVYLNELSNLVLELGYGIVPGEDLLFADALQEFLK